MPFAFPDKYATRRTVFIRVKKQNPQQQREDQLVMNIDLHPKQTEAFKYLRTKGIHTIVYGGGVGGGKSYLGCFFILWAAITYPGTRWLIGRKQLSDLRISTVITLKKVAKDLGILDKLMTGWNQSTNTIKISIDEQEESEIILKQLDVKEGDEEFISLGGVDLSGCLIDECGEISITAYRTIMQRLRHRLPPFGPKCLLVTNPTKNWVYDDIYLAWESGHLPDSIKYVPALPKDNPKLPDEAKALLTIEILGPQLYASRVLGDWHATTTDFDLVTDADVHDCFEWTTDGIDAKEPFVSWDPAYLGKDRSCVCLWRGMILDRVWIWKQRDPLEQIADVKRIISENRVPIRNVVIDGTSSATLIAHFKGAVDFRANNRALNGEPFASLKDQCYFRLAQAIKEKTIRFKTPEIRKDFAQELIAHKVYRADSDRPASVLKKPIVSRMLRRSPDISDAISFRMYFLLSKRTMTVRFSHWA